MVDGICSQDSCFGDWAQPHRFTLGLLSSVEKRRVPRNRNAVDCFIWSCGTTIQGPRSFTALQDWRLVSIVYSPDVQQ